ncbi:7264_t:CDS:10 [Funneliformis geosporum]|uniref:GPI ethanolamine phosphate transferase 2 n=1 Tax=Funneliformis geosporum TaxID=1117311 RepID=A0A9W4SEK2_9GLOM|nr:7264_t:CDS:10 [Funneliformis geosporum]
MNSHYSTRKKWQTLLNILILQLLGIFFFAKGFFPYKANLSGLSSINDLPPLPTGEKILPPKPKFDRLVFMLIDALRSDFVFGKNSGLKFVQSLISEKLAIPYTAIATAPTVTLPRIKALTTGTVPNFLDAILNIAESDNSSSLASQDNWLVQLKNVGNKSISFFGDDTWIKLFPGLFHETDGTTSFFAADTVEVDVNVTRNVAPQLSKSEWDVLIFHYLGLDHIGHSSGPRSPLMLPKQHEMDEVVKMIYETILEQDKKRIRDDLNAKPTLFVLCGDHGMNEAGNHGGSSIGEISTAFVFMSSEFISMKHVPETFSIPNDEHSMSFYKVINQVDYVSTISYLFGVPIPKNNLGILLLDLIGDIDALEKLRALQLNAHQIAGILQSIWSSFDRNPNVAQSELDCDINSDDDQVQLQCLYSRAYYNHAKSLEFKDISYINDALSFYNKSSSRLSSSFSDYDLVSMFVGLCFMILAVTFYLVTMVKSYVQWNKRFNIQSKNLQTHLELLSILGTVGFCFTLFASSYIEEEHQFWSSIKTPFIKQAFVLVCKMILIRLIRAWNQTGQKFAGEIDIRFYLNTSYINLMWILYFNTISALTIITLREIHKLFVINKSRQSTILQLITQLLVIIIAISVTKYKLELDGDVKLFPKLFNLISLIIRTTQIATLARIIYMLLAISLVLCTFGMKLNVKFEKGSSIRNFPKITLCLITYLFILLSRPHNVPLYGLYYLQYYLFLKLVDYSTVTATNNDSLLTPLSYNFLIISFEFLSFFSLGNSNSLSSIDISHSYTGINNYNVTFVGLLTFLGNWSGPIWWCFASIILRNEILIRWKLSKEIRNEEIDISEEKVFIKDKIIYDSSPLKITLFSDYYIYTSLFHSIVIFTLSIGVMILRNHLFIWTVFSPKYLFQIVWNILFHLGIELILIGAFERLNRI